jgi:hypothetical protein
VRLSNAKHVDAQPMTQRAKRVASSTAPANDFAKMDLRLTECGSRSRSKAAIPSRRCPLWVISGRASHGPLRPVFTQYLPRLSPSFMPTVCAVRRTGSIYDAPPERTSERHRSRHLGVTGDITLGDHLLICLLQQLVHELSILWCAQGNYRFAASRCAA